MGLGKTRIALELVQIFGPGSRLLFVTPVAVVPHINAEIQQFLPDHRHASVTVTSYTGLQIDVSTDVLVIDECHAMYNKKQLVGRLSKITRRFCVLLTGSAGSTHEIKAMWDKLVLSPTPPLVFRYDPPPLRPPIIQPAQEHIVSLQMPSQMTEQYNSFVQDIRDAKGLQSVNRMLALRKWLATRKIPEVLRILNTSLMTRRSSKFVVFSSFNSVLLELQLSLGPQAVCVTGTVNANRRNILLSTFRDDVSKHVLLASLNLFSHGIDLGFCHGLLHVDPPWTRVSQLQTNARIARIGQVADQEIVFLVWANSLESRLVEANKLALIDISSFVKE